MTFLYQIVIRNGEGEMILPAYREWPVAGNQAYQLSQMLRGRAVVALVYGEESEEHKKVIVLDAESGMPSYEIFLNQLVNDLVMPIEEGEDIPW